jgi:uncharacterized Zn-binding protein involved in type VI secretion
MADEKATAQDGQFVLISMPPDVCWTPIGKKKVPIPYPIVHTMADAQQCSRNVFFNGNPAYLHANSYVDNVTGDEPGVKGGVVTGVNMKVSHSQKHSSTVYINGKPSVRTGDMVLMNTKKP